ncbi:hypothetical protein IMZ48_47660 [Candidatus Bathyarchaeota archaeon]|nr:hypothetical protein [Candidatus Bathyarchaeota archaeon]
MGLVELYKASLELSTQADTHTDRNERQDVPVVSDGDRVGCERWLVKIGVFGPGQDDETWEKIKTNWVVFLLATSLVSDAALALNRKVHRSGSGEKREREKEARFSKGRYNRMDVQAAAGYELDGLEDGTESRVQ